VEVSPQAPVSSVEVSPQAPVPSTEVSPEQRPACKPCHCVCPGVAFPKSAPAPAPSFKLEPWPSARDYTKIMTLSTLTTVASPAVSPEAQSTQYSSLTYISSYEASPEQVTTSSTDYHSSPESYSTEVDAAQASTSTSTSSTSVYSEPPSSTPSSGSPFELVYTTTSSSVVEEAISTTTAAAADWKAPFDIDQYDLQSYVTQGLARRAAPTPPS
jgi:hypothetical protein